MEKFIKVDYRPCKKLETKNFKEKYKNKIFDSFRYGKFKIIGVYQKTKTYHLKYIIKFLETGGINICNSNQFIKGNVVDTSERFCSICGKSSYEDKSFRFKSKYGKNLCSKHFYQIQKYGHPQLRTLQDRNDYIIIEDSAIFNVYNFNNEFSGNFIVDLEDVDKIKNHSWAFGVNKKSIVSRINGKITLLHRLIINATKGEIIDHINRDPTNNKKSNLRRCTSQQNTFNCSLSKNNTSGIIGVWFQKTSKLNPWVSELMLNRKKVFRGYYKIKEDAIIARLKAELKYFGAEFAPQRHLFKDYNIP